MGPRCNCTSPNHLAMQGLACMSTEICSATGRTDLVSLCKMKPDERLSHISWRHISLAESLLCRWSQLHLLGYTYVRKRSQCLKLNFNWLVYNLCADIEAEQIWHCLMAEPTQAVYLLGRGNFIMNTVGDGLQRSRSEPRRERMVPIRK